MNLMIESPANEIPGPALQRRAQKGLLRPIVTQISLVYRPIKIWQLCATPLANENQEEAIDE